MDSGVDGTSALAIPLRLLVVKAFNCEVPMPPVLPLIALWIWEAVRYSNPEGV
jgi:hypothetical protein